MEGQEDLYQALQQSRQDYNSEGLGGAFEKPQP